jgi:NADH dehydrogenase
VLITTENLNLYIRCPYALGDLRRNNLANIQERKKIVILGAGVAGLRVAQRLERHIDPDKIQIILIDENNYHQYLYRIHEVCNLEYDEEDIIVDISRLLQNKSVEFIQTSVKTVDPANKIVKTSNGEQSYDILIIALGSHVAYFGIEGIEENSMTLESYEAAKRVRKKIRNVMEKAEGSGRFPNIVIGGGGFTGVELAGELTDCLPVLAERHGFENPDKWFTIVEAMPTILPGWDEKLVIKAQEFLKSRGSELILNDPVVKVSPNRIELKSGTILEPDLFIWTGGVRGDPACGMEFEISSRRITIDDYCRAIGFENIFVAGDSACTVDEKTGRPMPPTAHIAMVQADIVTHNIVASLKGGEMKKYVFNRAGEIVTLGRTYAVGDLFGVKFSGWLAKLMKKIVHWWYLHSIGGFRLLFGI